MFMYKTLFFVQSGNRYRKEMVGDLNVYYVCLSRPVSRANLVNTISYHFAVGSLSGSVEP
jgi:hypothetical protein